MTADGDANGDVEETSPTWLDRRREYENLARQICPCARLTTKDARLWRMTGRLLQLASLGRFTSADFSQRFATTLGPVQAYPRDWESLSKAIIAHESRHTAQFLFAGWFVPVIGWLPAPVRVWIGILPMTVAYGFFPLPIALAWGRYRLELDAESYAWRIGLRQGWLTETEIYARAERLAMNVSGPAYLWAWPRRWAMSGLRREARRVIQAHQSE